MVTQGKQDAAHWVIQFSLSYSSDGRHWAEYKENSVARVSEFLNSIHVLFLGGVKLPRKISTCSRGLCQSYHLNHLIDKKLIINITLQKQRNLLLVSASFRSFQSPGGQKCQ